MNQFKCSWSYFQASIFCLLVIILWSNRQSDGRILCEFRQYEEFQGYDSEILAGINLKFVEYDEKQLCYHTTPLIDMVPLLELKYVETHPAVRWLMTEWPSTASVFPGRIKSGYYHTLVVSLTPQQLALMDEALKRGANFTVFAGSTKIP